jgi:hypothetical protein
LELFETKKMYLREQSNRNGEPHHLQNRNQNVPPSGIEPPSSESESEILSIKLQRQKRNAKVRIIELNQVLKY